ncbi:HAD family hydrolase [Desulfococcaceae bacterium HSG9]|nr:HAD family hydrolase [Desulfococcaceae bacterium HSG9]
MKSGSPFFASVPFSKAKGILFDIDGTLYYQMPVRLIMILLFVIENISKPNQLKKKAQIIVAYRNAMETLRKSDISNINQIDMTVKNTGATSKYVSNVVKEWFETKPLPFLKLFRRKGMVRVLDTLCKKGFKLGVFSDYPAHDKLKALNVSDYFSVAVSASDSEISGFKPNTTGFHVSAREMGLKCSEIVYVGDRPEVDGIGALSAGIPVIILNSFWKSKNASDFPSVSSFHKLLEILLCPPMN